MKRQNMTLALVLLLFGALLANAGQSNPAQTGESEAFNKATRIAQPAERIKALEQFVKDYPSSTRVGSAYLMMFNAYIGISKDQKLIEYAEKAIEPIPEDRRAGTYNSIAWQLAENDVYLDKAYDYIKRGVELARKQNVNKQTLAMYLDTMAWLEYKLGDCASAEKNQREAISYLPQGGNIDYQYRLGLILAKSGANLEEAADLLAAALLLNEPKDGEKHFNQLLESLTAPDPQKKRTEIFKKAGDKYISSASDKLSAQCRVAIGYAKNGVLADEAIALAKQAVDSLTQKSTIESVLEFNKALGIVHFYRKNYQEALAYLQKIAPLASPFDTDLHLRLGQTLEALGRNDDAIQAYLNGIAAFPNPKIMEPLTALYKRVNGSDDGLKERIAKFSDEIVNFKPTGPVKKSKTGQVVLAELFTGSECPPCVASDIAFDHLLEAYDRKAVAVLEYHLHIPGPDPMTNDDTEARAKYYSVTGTPTVFIAGADSIRGGGPKAVNKNRFDVYSYVIDQKLNNKPAVSIELDGSIKQSTLTVKAEAIGKEVVGDLKLRIALVEELVHFPGGNGLSEHRAVVRKLIGSPDGIALVNGKASHSESIDINAIVSSLKTHLDNFEKTPPSRFSSLKDFKFKEKKHEINPAGLSLVAFVQDDKTKEVLQASYLKLNSGAKTEPASER